MALKRALFCCAVAVGREVASSVQRKTKAKHPPSGRAGKGRKGFAQGAQGSWAVLRGTRLVCCRELLLYCGLFQVRMCGR